MKLAVDRRMIISWLKTFLIAIIIIIFIKGFVGDISYVRSPSMNNTFQEGDFYFISKLSYGPRLIKTPLSIPFVTGKFFSSAIQLPYVRLFGEPDISRNDLVVFNLPYDERPVDHKEQYIKRCIAVAGDTIEIREGTTYVNGKTTDDSLFCIYNYIIKLKDGTNDTAFFENFGLSADSRISDEGHYSFYVPDSTIANMQATGKVEKAEKQIEKKKTYDETIFPFSEKLSFNADNFGPLYIPKRGDTLNFVIYERLLNFYEEAKAEITNGKVIVDGDSSGTHVIKMNYYFLMGDSRHDSRDSRHWGFVPEDHIIGKASFIFYSFDRKKGEFRSNRWFKGI